MSFSPRFFRALVRDSSAGKHVKLFQGTNPIHHRRGSACFVRQHKNKKQQKIQTNSGIVVVSFLRNFPTTQNTHPQTIAGKRAKWTAINYNRIRSGGGMFFAKQVRELHREPQTTSASGKGDRLPSRGGGMCENMASMRTRSRIQQQLVMMTITMPEENRQFV